VLIHLVFLPHSFPDFYSDSFKREVDHFAEVLQGKEQPIVQAEESIGVARVVEALTESYYSGKVVHLDKSPKIKVAIIGQGSFTKNTHQKKHF